MSKSTTKLAIAFAFKELLLEKPLNKITINDIAEKCEMITFMTFWSSRNGYANQMQKEH